MKIHVPSENCKSKSSFPCCAPKSIQMIYIKWVRVCSPDIFRNHMPIFCPLLDMHVHFSHRFSFHTNFRPSLPRFACSHRHTHTHQPRYHTVYSFVFNSFSFETNKLARKTEMEWAERKKKREETMCATFVWASDQAQLNWISTLAEAYNCIMYLNLFKTIRIQITNITVIRFHNNTHAEQTKTKPKRSKGKQKKIWNKSKNM